MRPVSDEDGVTKYVNRWSCGCIDVRNWRLGAMPFGPPVTFEKKWRILKPASE